MMRRVVIDAAAIRTDGDDVDFSVLVRVDGELVSAFDIMKFDSREGVGGLVRAVEHILRGQDNVDA